MLHRLKENLLVETFAALLEVSEALPRGTQGQEIYVRFDGESMVKTLMSPVVTSKLVTTPADLIHEDWVKAEHSERWKEYDGGMHTKFFLAQPNGK